MRPAPHDCPTARSATGASVRRRRRRCTARVAASSGTAAITAIATERQPSALSKSIHNPNIRNSTLAKVCSKPRWKPLIQQCADSDRQAVGQDHAQRLPIHTPAQSCSLAKVTVASVVLSLISASENDDITESRAKRCSSRGRDGFVRRLEPSRQAHTAKIRKAIADAKAKGARAAPHPESGRSSPRPVRKKRSDRHPGQHDPPSVAQRVGHRDQLGPVAEFGKENHPETEQRRRA